MTLEQRRRDMLPTFISLLDCIDEGQEVPMLEDTVLNALLDYYRKGVSRRQVVVYYTKWMHQFNIVDVSKDLGYLQGELDEAKQAWESEGIENFVRELADVAIYCYGIAQMLGIDLDSVIREKMEFNIQRSYEKEGDV